MEQVTILSFMGFTEAQLNKLRAVSPWLEVHQMTEAAFEEVPDELREQVNILYGWGPMLFEAHRYPRLKWIQAHSAGVNTLRDKPLWQSDIILTNAAGIHPVPMAEHALMMMLAFRWELSLLLDFQGRREWAKDRWEKFSRPELRGSTLGIVGYGAIGRELARQADALGMRILAVNSSGLRSAYRGFNIPDVGDLQATLPERLYSTEDLLKMLPECDYVVVLAPLTDETRHLVGAEAFAAMKSSAFFFNLARGELVDEAALIEALRQGQIAGAGLDVFETEPLPADSPLWDFENIIISPHISGFTPLYDERASDLFAENLQRYLNNEPLLNIVNKERGY